MHCVAKEKQNMVREMSGESQGILAAHPEHSSIKINQI